MKHCLVKNAFDNGTLLILAENNDGLQRLAIHFPQDTLEQGILVDLTLQVDKQDVFPVEGMTSTPRILAMNVPEVFADQMRKGSVLRIRGPEDEIAYQLQGTDKAVRGLRDCVASHKNPAMVRTKLAAISDADADVHAQQPARPIMPAEMMATLPEPVTADALKNNLDLKSGQVIAAVDTEMSGKKIEIAKTDTAQAVTKTAATQSLGNTVTVQKAADDLLPMKWNYIFNSVAAAPQSTTSNANKLGMTPPLQYAWTVNTVKIGLNLGKPLDEEGLDQSAKHYMFNMRRGCQGEFLAEADEQKVTSNGLIRWQIAETVCAGKKGETMTALLFTTSGEESVITAIEGKMQDAPHLIRLRNDVLQAMNK